MVYNYMISYKYEICFEILLMSLRAIGAFLRALCKYKFLVTMINLLP